MAKSLKITLIGAFLLAWAVPALAGNLVFDLDSNRVYSVSKDANSTVVIGLNPGPAQVTIGNRLPGGSTVFQSPRCPSDDMAKGLAGQDDDSGDVNDDGEE